MLVARGSDPKNLRRDSRHDFRSREALEISNSVEFYQSMLVSAQARIDHQLGRSHFSG